MTSSDGIILIIAIGINCLIFIGFFAVGFLLTGED